MKRCVAAAPSRHQLCRFVRGGALRCPWLHPEISLIFAARAHDATRCSSRDRSNAGVATSARAGRAGRAFAYVLLVVTCTLVAALGGYQIGTRTQPETTQAPTARQLDAAVAAAVKKQKAADRADKRADMAAAMAWQREKFDRELSQRVNEVRLAEAENAARAYRRGKAAGAATAAVEATEKVSEER